jgi:hypothetical protein
VGAKLLRPPGAIARDMWRSVLSLSRAHGRNSPAGTFLEAYRGKVEQTGLRVRAGKLEAPPSFSVDMDDDDGWTLVLAATVWTTVAAFALGGFVWAMSVLIGAAK